MLSLLAALALTQCSPEGPVFSCPSNHPLPPDPWAFYPLNDGSDSVIDDRGPNDLDLTVTFDDAGFPMRRGSLGRFFSRRQTTGILAQASNYASLTMIAPATIHAATQTYVTVGFSFERAPLDGGTGLEAVLQYGGGGVSAGGDGHGEMIEVRAYRAAGVCSADRLSLAFTDSGGTSRVVCFTYAILDGLRFHATIVMDPTSAGHFTPRLYIDGVLHDSGSEQLDPTLFTKTLDGGYLAVSLRRNLVPPGGQVGGVLRDVAIYARPLTALEIAALAARRP